MGRIIVCILFIFIISTSSFSADTPTSKIKRIENYIAVFDIEATGKVDRGISRPLSETIRFEVVKIGKYDVIDRSNMDKILSEQKFQLSGCISGECVVEAGQLLGVGKIVTGSINIVGNVYYLSLSLINVETGKIENVSEDKCSCEQEELINVSKRLVRRLFEAQVPSIPVVKDPITGMEFVFVKGGCFEMGDIFGDGTLNERPVHEVCIDNFYIGKYEATQGQWQEIMGDSPNHFTDGANYPVKGISWDDAQEFIKKLNQKAGKKYRLPTEAEWEYAARSRGKNEKWAGTNDKLEVDDYAWYASNSAQVHLVGKKKPNSLGLHDMSGNVQEWVSDGYTHYNINASKNNPKGPSTKVTDARVLRGGYFELSLRYISTVTRVGGAPTVRYPAAGLRLVFSEK